MTYTKTDLVLLDKIVNDIDLQLKEFNEVIPYEYNKNAYSPRLVNLLLTTCTIIERFCKLIQLECNLAVPTPANGGIRQLLASIDHDGVLSNMDWTTAFYDQFQPFDGGTYNWWKLYNDTKHEISFSVTDVKYCDVITAIVALHSLQRLVYAKLTTNWTTLHGADLLDITKWDKSTNLGWQTSHELFHTYTAPKK